jgi:hypothetical protein
MAETKPEGRTKAMPAMPIAILVASTKEREEKGHKMIHAELIQEATDLMSAQVNADAWLPLYDAALASDNDRELEIFCNLAGRALELRAA